VKKGKTMKKKTKGASRAQKTASIASLRRKLTPKVMMISLFAVVFALFGVKTLASHAQNGCVTRGNTTTCRYRNIGNGRNGTGGTAGQDGQNGGSVSFSGDSGTNTTTIADGSIVSNGNQVGTNGSSSCTINGQPCNGVSGTDGQSTPSVSNNQQNSGGNNGHKSTSRKVLDAVTAPFRAVGRGVKRLVGGDSSSQSSSSSAGQQGSSQTVSISQTSPGQPGQSSSSTSQSGDSSSSSVSETVTSTGNTGQMGSSSNSSPDTPGVSNSTDVTVVGQNGQPGQDGVTSTSGPGQNKSFGRKVVDFVTAPFRAVGRGVKHLFGR
jgi:hypothetical protein